MAIFIDKDTRLVVQGITGRDGAFHALQMLEYGTEVVAASRRARAARSSTGFPVPIFDTWTRRSGRPAPTPA
jgi:succinyl-CoA synthetase alpha subunit